MPVTDLETVKRFAHVQVEVNVTLQIKKRRITVPGYSKLIKTDSLVEEGDADYLKPYIKGALRQAVSLIRERYPSLKYDAVKAASGTLNSVSLVFRKFTTTYQPEVKTLNKQRFRELYEAFKLAYGKGAKSAIAKKFNIGKRSVENYLQGRIPKGIKFTTGLTALVQSEKYTGRYRFALKSPLGEGVNLTQSLLTDISGLIRNHVTKPGEANLFTWDGAQFYDMLDAIAEASLKGDVLTWLLMTISGHRHQ